MGGGGESSKFSTHISATAANYAAYQQKLFSSVAIMIVETTNSGESRQNIKGALKKFSGGSGLLGMRKVFMRRAIPCCIKSGLHYTVIWLAYVQYLIYLERESLYWMKRKLNSISVLFCQINQLLDKYQIKQLFYHSCPNFSHVPLTIIRSNYKQVHHAQWSLLKFLKFCLKVKFVG